MSIEKPKPTASSAPVTNPANQAAPAGKKSGVFTKIFITLVIAIGAFAVFVATRPSEFRVSRTATISAPAEVVFAQVNDFHNWEAWSPWAKLDPAAKNSFEGASSGKGAIFQWKGNAKVGEGQMTITDSHPTDRIAINLHFVSPFEATNAVEFTFKPEGDKTQVTWNMTGTRNFVSKGICVFMDMDKMVGEMFEKGLASINAKVGTKS